jgi:hypothetical protein
MHGLEIVGLGDRLDRLLGRAERQIAALLGRELLAVLLLLDLIVEHCRLWRPQLGGGDARGRALGCGVTHLRGR